MTLNLVKDRLWKGGACTKPVLLGQATGTITTCPSGTSRLGQVVLVPVGQSGCLYQTCPTRTRKGQRRPLLVPWDRSYTHAEGLSLSRVKLYTHDGVCPSFTCPNLFLKVGLQGRGFFLRILWIFAEKLHLHKKLDLDSRVPRYRRNTMDTNGRIRQSPDKQMSSCTRTVKQKT